MASRDAFKLTGGINICTVFLMKRYKGSEAKVSLPRIFSFSPCPFSQKQAAHSAQPASAQLLRLGNLPSRPRMWAFGWPLIAAGVFDCLLRMEGLEDLFLDENWKLLETV